MTDEERRTSKLLRTVIWIQLAVFGGWLVTASVVAPYAAGIRAAMFAVLLAVSLVAFKLLARGRYRAAAASMVAVMWLVLVIRNLELGILADGSWFGFAVLVAEAGLFLGMRAVFVAIAASAIYGLVLVLLVDRGVVVAESAGRSMLVDWMAGLLVFCLVAALQYASVRLIRAALDASREAANRHRALFDNTPVALFELDLTGTEIVVADRNAAAVALVGRDQPFPAAAATALRDALRAGRTAVDQELELALGDTPRRVVLRAELGELARVVASLVDVTEQRSIARRLHEAQRFETVASLAGSVAHDFNNMLTVAQLNVERLARRMPDSRELDRIRDAHARAASSTRQLLIFSRRGVTRRQVFAPTKILADLEGALRRTLDKSIRLAIEGESGLAVDMDVTQFEQLVTNLVQNAADAMPTGGTLTIAVTRHDSQRICLAVTDTGHGIDAATQARVFEPFFTTRFGKRAGLGLAIARTIVHDAGGTIELESSPAGTRVAVLFPAVEQPVATTRVQPTNAERILVVEDEDGIRESVCTTLAEAGYAVTAVRSGNEALAAFGVGDRVDLVVSDLVLPDLNGRALVDRMRVARPTLPVLYVSGFAADGVPALEHDRHAGFLAKPFTSHQLLSSIRSVLS